MDSGRPKRNTTPSSALIDSAQNSQNTSKKMKKKDLNKENNKEEKEDKEMESSQITGITEDLTEEPLSQLEIVSLVPEMKEKEGTCKECEEIVNELYCKKCTEIHCRKCIDDQKEIEKLKETIKTLRKEK